MQPHRRGRATRYPNPKSMPFHSLARSGSRRFPVLASCAALLLLLSTSVQAQKSCRYAFGVRGPAVINFRPPATITLTGNERVGDALGIWPSTTSLTSEYSLLCTSSMGGLSGLIGWGGAVAGTYSTRSTGIPGIGYAIITSHWLGGIRSFPDNMDGGTPLLTLPVSLAFMRTAGTLPTVDQTLSPQQPLAQWIVGSNGLPLAIFNLANAVTFAMPGRKTCAITLPAGAVDLGQQAASQFTSTGSGSPWTDFGILFECTGLRGRVHMTVTDAHDTSNRSDALTLAAQAGTARGLQVQLQKQENNPPLLLGPDTGGLNAQNRFFIFDATNTPSYTLRLRARMVRTGPVLEAGRVSAAATITTSYQ